MKISFGITENAQMRSRWRVDASENEWQNVMKTLHECLFRLLEVKKGLQVTDLPCLRRNIDLLLSVEGKVHTVIFKPYKHKRVGCPTSQGKRGRALL